MVESPLEQKFLFHLSALAPSTLIDNAKVAWVADINATLSRTGPSELIVPGGGTGFMGCYGRIGTSANGVPLHKYGQVGGSFFRRLFILDPMIQQRASHLGIFAGFELNSNEKFVENRRANGQELYPEAVEKAVWSYNIDHNIDVQRPKISMKWAMQDPKLNLFVTAETTSLSLPQVGDSYTNLVVPGFSNGTLMNPLGQLPQFASEGFMVYEPGTSLVDPSYGLEIGFARGSWGGGLGAQITTYNYQGSSYEVTINGNQHKLDDFMGGAAAAFSPLVFQVQQINPSDANLPIGSL